MLLACKAICLNVDGLHQLCKHRDRMRTALRVVAYRSQVEPRESVGRDAHFVDLRRLVGAYV